MDVFLAALKVGETGSVVVVDMTDEQVNKAERLRNQYGVSNVSFLIGHIENLPFEDSSFDAVISNGVINLCPDKIKVFEQITRILKPNGRLATAEIVPEKPLSANIVCNATLWASCIGGAAQKDYYHDAIEKAGLQITFIRPNNHDAFISASAQDASDTFVVKSISLLAIKMKDTIEEFDCGNKPEQQNLLFAKSCYLERSFSITA